MFFSRVDPRSGQYKIWSADYGLRTTDYGLGIKHGLNFVEQTKQVSVLVIY